MKAHKVPATYYAAWKIPGKNHSFYVFIKINCIMKDKARVIRKLTR